MAQILARLALLLIIGDITGLASVEIEAAPRKWTRRITETGELRKAQTIPEAPANPNANLESCCQGTAFYSILHAVLAGQTGRGTGSSAKTGGAKNEENNGENNQQGNTEGEGSGAKNEENNEKGNTEGKGGAKNEENIGEVENNQQGNTEGESNSQGNTTKEANQSPHTSSQGALQKFRETSLHYHNLKRAINSAPDLSLDENLNRGAQEWAENLARRKTVEHSPLALSGDHEAEGENIAQVCRADDQEIENGEEKMTNMWYNEVKKYDWNNPVFSPYTGHFTQLVWKNTQKVGFGAASYRGDDNNLCHVAVALYSPEGNVDGQFKENVMKGSYGG